MQEFFINQNSVNPPLRMELINEGRYDFKRDMLYSNSIQNADVTFSMKNISNDALKISKSKAEVVESLNAGCKTKFLLQYKWKERDVKDKGIYKGWFEIKFHDDAYSEDMEMLQGNLIVPIKEELIINVL
jgi:hypothetical protein